MPPRASKRNASSVATSSLATEPVITDVEDLSKRPLWSSADLLDGARKKRQTSSESFVVAAGGHVYADLPLCRRMWVLGLAADVFMCHSRASTSAVVSLKAQATPGTDEAVREASVANKFMAALVHWFCLVAHAVPCIVEPSAADRCPEDRESNQDKVSLVLDCFAVPLIRALETKGLTPPRPNVDMAVQALSSLPSSSPVVELWHAADVHCNEALAHIADAVPATAATAASAEYAGQFELAVGQSVRVMSDIAALLPDPVEAAAKWRKNVGRACAAGEEEEGSSNDESSDGGEVVVSAKKGKHAVKAPANWREILDRVREMRAEGGVAGNAPVDTMGCGALGDKDALPKVFRFQTLVALMLSSQTKDEATSHAVNRLKTELTGGLTLESLLASPRDKVHECIKGVGFHQKKVDYLYRSAEICKNDWDGDIPRTVEELCSLPGVGPKMATICNQVAWGDLQGIGVDTHVHRITNMWRWHKTTTPEGTRAALESWLPRSEWRDINPLLVGFGQRVCGAVAPKCNICILARDGLCPASRVKKSAWTGEIPDTKGKGNQKK